MGLWEPQTESTVIPQHQAVKLRGKPAETELAALEERESRRETIEAAEKADTVRVEFLRVPPHGSENQHTGQVVRFRRGGITPFFHVLCRRDSRIQPIPGVAVRKIRGYAGVAVVFVVKDGGITNQSVGYQSKEDILALL